jgi:IS30 family transposase
MTRELQRNTSRRGYRPQYAHRKAVGRRREKAKPRITEQTWTEVEEKLTNEQWSPEQINGKRKLDGKQTVSHEWIYQRVYRDKESGGSLYTNLRCQKKRRKRYGTYSKRGGLVNQVSIEERPEIVDEKTRLGDWEVDTIIGKNHQGAIVTLTERKSKLLKIERIDNKTGELTGDAIIEKLNDLIVHTITSDNGKEFSDHERIARILETDFYFCHPYASWERGLNENTNGLIRQYFRKKTEFAKISREELQEVEDKLNNRPRKTLGYLTPLEVYSKESTKQLTRVALTT